MIVFDLETTGLLAPGASDIKWQPHITEFAAVKLDQCLQIIDEMQMLVNPGIPIPEEVAKSTHITDDMVKDAPPFTAIYHQMCKFFCGEEAMLSHNLPFDKGVLMYELRRIGKEHAFPWPWDQKCSVEASFSIHNKRMNLSDLHLELTGKRFADAHRAMNDVKALVTCVRGLVERGLL